MGHIIITVHYKTYQEALDMPKSICFYQIKSSTSLICSVIMHLELNNGSFLNIF